MGVILLASPALAGPAPSGSFYAGNGILHEYTAGGDLVRSFSPIGGAPSLAISPVTNNLFAVDPAANTLWYVDFSDIAYPNGKVTSWTNAALNNPYYLVFAPNNRLYLTNRGTNTVLELLVEAPGTPWMVTRSTIGSGRLSSPSGIAFDPASLMYIGNGTNQIVVLDSRFRYQRTMTIAGLNTPGGMIYSDTGALYVVSTGTDNVLEVNPLDGSVIRVLNGNLANPLVDPRDLTISADGTLLVADAVNGVVEFDLEQGVALRTLPIGSALGIAAVVPEPATMALMGLGIVALAGYRRRRK